jgi:hypothetical protein
MTEAEGPTTHQWINPVTETIIEANHFTRHRLEIEVDQNFRRRKQQMMRKPIKLFSPKQSTRIACWSVRTMYQSGKSA